MSDPVESARLDGLRAAGYELQSLIGRGGMAYVYRAEDTRLGRIVAVKVLAPELAQNEEFRLRFLRESRLAASLDHPNIIPIYEAGEADGHLYLAMRYVEGADLKVVLKRRGTLTPDETMGLFSQVGAALDAAHRAGLVHRDVKPANILVSAAANPNGRDHVYLSDFGLTKRASSLTGVTATGIVVGTMDYVAPEQIGGKPVDSRTDVYALGCVVYQALTGKVPFIRDDDAALLWAHLMEMPTSISSVRPEIPAAVDQVLATAMAKGPEGRFGSCGEFIAALDAALGGKSMALPAADIEPSSAPPAATQAPQQSAPGWSAPPQSGAGYPPQSGAGYPPLPTAQLPGGEYSPDRSQPAAPNGVPPQNQTQPPNQTQHPSQGQYPNQYSPTQFPPAGYPPQQYSPAVGPQSAPPRPHSAPPQHGSGLPYPYSAPPHPGSAPPFPYSAPPHQGSAPPYPYSAPPSSASTAGGGPASPAPSGRLRRVLVGGLAAALVLAVSLVIILLVKPFEEGTKHFSANNVLPASFDYPESWKTVGSGTNIAFSPRAADAYSLFSTRDWTRLDRALKDDPDSVVGVYTVFSTSAIDAGADARKSALINTLPPTAGLDSQETTVVGGHDATRHDGELSEDSGDGELRIRCFVTTNTATNQSVVFIFFAANSAWDKNQEKFKALLSSVTFPS